MVFNATFNNISVISWRSFLLVEESGVHGENNRQTLSHNNYPYILAIYMSVIRGYLADNYPYVLAIYMSVIRGYLADNYPYILAIYMS
jgi:hypothetical protein